MKIVKYPPPPPLGAAEPDSVVPFQNRDFSQVRLCTSTPLRLRLYPVL